MQTGESSRPQRARKLGWLSAVSSLALVALSVALVDARSFGAALKAIDPRWLGAAILLYLAQLALLGLRWSLVARELGLRLGVGRATGEYAVSILVNQVLPGGIAGDALRALRHARALPGQSLGPAIEALAIDRASGQLALVLLALVTAPLGVTERILDPKAFLLGAAGLVGLGLLLGLALTRFAAGRRALGAAGRFAGRAARVLVRPRSAIVHLPLSLVFVLVTLLGFYVAARALSVELGAARLFWVGPWILLAASLPASVGGWGVREGASAALFGAAGLAPSAGLAVSVVYGAFSLIAAVLGFAGSLLVRLFRARALRDRQPRGAAWRSALDRCRPRRYR